MHKFLKMVLDFLQVLFANRAKKLPVTKETIVVPDVESPAIKQVEDKPELPGRSYESFRDAIGLRESSNNYQVKNVYGFMGRYQFGMPRLTDLGLCRRVSGKRGMHPSCFVWISPFSENVFLNSPKLQDAVFDAHVRSLSVYIKKRYEDVLGTEVHGHMFTLSGAIAGAHLLGLGGVKDFLEGRIGADANGTKFTDYLNLFAGYTIPTVWEQTSLKLLVQEPLV